MADKMLTTIDNRWNPFTDFDRWFDLDFQLGHNCSQYVDRVMRSSENMTENEDEELYNKALNEIIENDITGIYKIVENNQ